MSMMNPPSIPTVLLPSANTECAHELVDELRVFRIGPFQSLVVALDTLARDAAWTRARPVMVHADVHTAVASLIIGVSGAHVRWTTLINPSP